MKKIIMPMMLVLISAQVYAGKIISKEDAEKILKETISSTPGCIVMDEFTKMPISIDPDNMATRDAASAMRALSEAGLLKMEKKQVKMEKNMGFMKQKVTINAHVFSMTDMGKKYFRDDAVQISKGRKEPKKGAGLCYSEKLKVTGIKRFVGPTVINYYLQAEDKADWANDEKIIRAGLIVDKHSMNIKTFQLKGQPAPPPGIKLQAQFRKQKDGTYALTHY